MNYYKLLKINSLIKSPRLKFLGLYIFHKLNKRYLSVQFDPINACNFRCKMCYFTDKDYVKKLKGVFNPNELPLFAKAILGRALKLQIGCGTEPTLYKDINQIIELGGKYDVPYISMTTNGNLLQEDKLENWVASGLNEITISLHGVLEKTYEELMQKGKYQLFIKSLEAITKVKQKFPNFILRINYTFNEDNFDELNSFWNIFGTIPMDIIQIRPITKIGNTEYSNFSLEKIIPKYEKLFQLFQKETSKRNISLIAPTLDQLQNRQSSNSIIRDFTSCYISPTIFWENDFDWKNETFNQYTKRTGWGKKIFKNIFASKRNIDNLKNKTLNYEIS